MSDRLLTEEGERLWKNLATASVRRQQPEVRYKRPKLENVKFNVTGVRLDFLEAEINKLIINSELVVSDCDKVIAKFSTAKEYLLSEAKIVKLIHENFIVRLNRLLASLPAFEDEKHLKEYIS